MSKPRRIPDAERTAAMTDLVFRANCGNMDGMSLARIVLEEVAQGTGWSASRWADMLVLGIWKGTGQTLDGYEIKASRADLKKELSDPTKAEAVARYCNSWSLVAWDESVLCDGIPESWGIILTTEGKHGRELTTHRKAAKRTPEPWTREFVCSMVRNAYQQSPGAAYVARACVEAERVARNQSKDTARNAELSLIGPLQRALYGDNSWKWPAEAGIAEQVVKLAAERLTQLPLGAP